jgi:hypothetical protein
MAHLGPFVSLLFEDVAKYIFPEFKIYNVYLISMNFENKK